MADFRAGVWLTLLMLYFFLLVMIVNSASNLEADISTYNTTIGDENIANKITSTNICSNPRFYFDTDGDVLEYSNARDDNLACRESKGAFSKDECNNLSGCSWVVINDTLWDELPSFVRRVYQAFNGGDDEASYCNGYINSSFYGVPSKNSGRHVALHQTSDTLLWGFANVWSDSPCSHENVLFNATSCNVFSCSWIDYDYAESLKATTIVSTFKDVFGYRYPFGFTNPTLKFLMNVFFVILPQILIVISAYFLIRG